jgi:hypothetical protein
MRQSRDVQIARDRCAPFASLFFIAQSRDLVACFRDRSKFPIPSLVYSGTFFFRRQATAWKRSKFPSPSKAIPISSRRLNESNTSLQQGILLRLSYVGPSYQKNRVESSPRAQDATARGAQARARNTAGAHDKPFCNGSTQGWVKSVKREEFKNTKKKFLGALFFFIISNSNFEHQQKKLKQDKKKGPYVFPDS